MNTKAIIKQFTSIYRNQGPLSLFVYLFKAFNDGYINKYFRGSFSQKGEDLVIEKFIGTKKRGFYIDVGAHNPNVFNNTKKFYSKGWRGINIEPNPVLFEAFTRERKRDINLNIGIGRTEGTALFYELEPDSLSTFSEKEMKDKLKLGYELRKKYKIKVTSLKEIISKYCKTRIDFLSIDTEGLDYEVLQSNDWKRFRPTLVCVETADFNSKITGTKKSNKENLINAFMKNNGYEEVFSNGLNSLYKDLKKN